MNQITLTKEEAENFEYAPIKRLIGELEQNPTSHKGTVEITFSDFKEEKGKPLFLHDTLKAWYMGLLYNVPNILYFLSDKRKEQLYWTDLQFAVMILSTIRVKSNNEKEMTFEVIMDAEIFEQITQQTVKYMLTVSRREDITVEDKEFFRHLVFDYTNGFE